MKTCKKLLSIMMCMLFAILCVCSLSSSSVKAASLNINLKNNQLFYILPGNEQVEYHVKITSGAQLGNQATYVSDNVSVAAIDSFGLLTIRDAGSAKISVTTGGHTVSRKITVLNRTDWTKVVDIKGYGKIMAKKNICSVKMTNAMDFPVRMVFTYNAYSVYNNLVTSDARSKEIYVAAKDTMTYQMYVEDNIKYISITDAKYDYNQYGYKSISTKNVSVKEKKSTKKNAVTIKETVTNNNKNKIVQPYMAYVYDKNGKLERIEYTPMVVNGRDRLTVKNTYYKTSTMNEYNSKITYKFLTPMPMFL